MYNTYVSPQDIAVEKLFLEGYHMRHDNGNNILMIGSRGNMVVVDQQGSVVSR